MIANAAVIPIVAGVFAGTVLASLSTLVRVASYHFYHSLQHAEDVSLRAL